MCSQCGASIKPGIAFCTNCGTPLNQLSSETTPGLATDLPSRDGTLPGDQIDTKPSRNNRKAAIALVVGLAAVGAVVGGLLMLRGAGDVAPVANPEPPASKAAEAVSSPSANTSASAAPSATAPSAPPASVEPTPTQVAPAQVTGVTGDWTGVLPGRGSKVFYLTAVMNENLDGSIDAQVRMDEVNAGLSTGNTGTQLMSGFRSGSFVELQGYAWAGGSYPSGWTLDTFVLTLSPNGNALNGTYSCPGCGAGDAVDLNRS